MATTMPDQLTLDALAQLQPPLPDVEVHGLDMGWYIVRLHRQGTVSVLVNADGETRRFTGTQWISRALAPLGFTHGILTWADAADEMIGTDVPPVSAEQRMAYGVRVAFDTRH